MTINRPENLFEGVTPAQYEESMREFPELAERSAAHRPMSQAEIEAGHRARTAQMIRLADLWPPATRPTLPRSRPRSTPIPGADRTPNGLCRGVPRDRALRR